MKIHFRFFCLGIFLLGIEMLATASGPVRVLFLGNSITYQGTYISMIESFYRLQEPGKRMEFLNLGLPSETVSGLSEPHHADDRFPRPDLHERLGRILKEIHPDLIFACYGMNDGIYLPYDAGRFAAFRNGIRWLHQQLAATGARVVHLTPPVYDETRGGAVGYASVLDRYSRWLLQQKDSLGWEVADLHFPMLQYLESQKVSDAGFALAPDGVHPGELGHWIMAKEILRYMGYSRQVNSSDNLEALLQQYPNGRAVYELVAERQGIMKDALLTTTRHTRPEMPVGLPMPEARQKAADLERRIDQLMHPQPLALWYTHPATRWEEALPVGNGRLGAMVYGNPVHETLQLNEESIWAGSKINNDNPRAYPHLEALRKALFQNEYDSALAIAQQNFIGTPPEVRSYQPLGNLQIDYQWPVKPAAYRRELNLHTGIATTSFMVNGTTITQQVFASAPDNCLVVVLESKGKSAITATLNLTRAQDARTIASADGSLQLQGQIIDAEDPKKGPGGAHMRFAGALRVKLDKGSLTADGKQLKIRNASRVLIVLTAATDYQLEHLDFDPSIDPVAICKTILGQAGQYSANQLRQRHLEDYQAIFSRVGFQLGPDSLNKLQTDTRLAAVKKGRRDNGLIPLYFQYGRYLLMSSSRKPGHLPANLQGIWNKEFNAPWNADFHTNINLQMNYWPAEVANLSETSEILAQFMKQIAVPGAVTAREMYGTKGWTLHHLTDPFGRTGVADGVWGITPMNGPWMCFPLYEHFLFTRDTGYLRTVAYPLLKGSAEFVLGFLSRSPEGYLVTNPSHSPENVFYDQVAKKQSSLTYSATIDVEITQALFDYCREASGILQTDADFIAQIEAARRQLPPIQVNSKGCIQEWVRDFEEPEPGHRHMSHLLGLYPLTLFTSETPALYAAARNSLERRLSNGGGHTGWSRAWIVNFYARLQDGNKADEHLQALLAKSTESNLFDMHPPFQIDGNFGGTAGIAEMLLQSHQDIIELLPALPAAWPEGEVNGLCARGGFELSIRWKKGRLVEAGITSKAGGEVKVRYHNQMHTIKLAPGGSAKLKF